MKKDTLKDLIWRDIDLSSDTELREIAEIHVAVPLHWNSEFQPEEAKVLETINRIQTDAQEKNLFFKLVLRDTKIIAYHWMKTSEVHNEYAAWSISLWVDESYRRHGIAQELKKQGEEWAKAKGTKFIWSTVHFNNKRMLEFNQKQGFKPGMVEMFKDFD